MTIIRSANPLTSDIDWDKVRQTLYVRQQYALELARKIGAIA